MLVLIQGIDKRLEDNILCSYFDTLKLLIFNRCLLDIALNYLLDFLNFLSLVIFVCLN